MVSFILLAPFCHSVYTRSNSIPLAVVNYAMESKKVQQVGDSRCKCSDEDRKRYVKQVEDGSFLIAARDVATSCKWHVMRPESCFCSRMEEKTGISAKCIECTYEDTLCFAKKCYIGHVRFCTKHPEECEKCGDEKCTPGFLRCTGFPPKPPANATFQSERASVADTQISIHPKPKLDARHEVVEEIHAAFCLPREDGSKDTEFDIEPAQNGIVEDSDTQDLPMCEGAEDVDIESDETVDLVPNAQV